MFIVVVFSILPCIRTRVPPIKKGGPLFDLSLFKDRGFTTMYLMVRERERESGCVCERESANV